MIIDNDRCRERLGYCLQIKLFLRKVYKRSTVYLRLCLFSRKKKHYNRIVRSRINSVTPLIHTILALMNI